MIGIIARMDDRGLGIQSKEFFDHIPCKALVIDPSWISGTRHKQHFDWYPGQKIFKVAKDLKIPDYYKEWLLKDIDTLFTFETPYDYSIYQMCRERNIKSILQLNYEFFKQMSIKDG